MNKITEELKKIGVFYVATADAEGNPHVRPFGAASEFEGKTYIITNNQKKCYAEMIAHPKIEISGTTPNGEWIRLNAEVKRDDRREARKAMLDAYPDLRSMYNEDDGIVEVLYLENVSCTEYSFTAEPKKISD